MQARLKKIEQGKIRIQAMIEKEINLQLTHLPMVRKRSYFILSTAMRSVIFCTIATVLKFQSHSLIIYPVAVYDDYDSY